MSWFRSMGRLAAHGTRSGRSGWTKQPVPAPTPPARKLMPTRAWASLLLTLMEQRQRPEREWTGQGRWRELLPGRVSMAEPRRASL